MPHLPATNRVRTIRFQPTCRRLGRLLAGLLAIFAGTGALANSAWFTRVWRTDEGLLNNTITAVVQTGDGFLWVGTLGGLVRFDGVSFVEVPYLSSGANPDLNVRILLPSRAGGLWIVPETGPLVCLNPDLSRASLPTETLPKANSIALTEDRDGFWVGYADGTIVRVKGGKVRQYGAAEGVPAGTVNSLLTDPEGNVWLAKGGTITVLRNDKFESITSSKTKVHVIAARTNGVWITAGLQILRCSAKGELQEFGNLHPATPTAIARTLIEDHAGNLWIGTDGGGLFHHNGTEFESVEVSHLFVSCLMEDAEGNVWAGTVGGGLNRVFPRAARLEGKQDGQSVIAIRSVCEDAAGVIWGVTQNGNLIYRADGGWSNSTLATSTNQAEVDCVTRHDGALWFGVHGRMNRWRDNTLKTWDTKGVGSLVTAMLSASNGDLWFCILGRVDTNATVLRIHNDKLENVTLPGAVGRRMVLAEDAAGKIWVGTSSGQLFRQEGDSFRDQTALTSLSGRAIRNLYATADGSLWIGYAGLGLGRIQNGKFARITSEQGLPENYISQIMGDDQGWLWIGGDRGIFKVRQLDLDAVIDHRAERLSPILYGKNEGLYSQQTDATISSGTIRSRDGRIWMPMRSALAVIDPGVRREQPRPPAVCLTRVSVDDSDVGLYGGAGGTQEIANLKTLKTPLKLSPRHHQVEFAFSALSFAAPENVRFRYRLEGFDEDWVNAGTQRSTRYSRLPAGEYRFRVAGCNSDGVWSEARLPVDIVVTPFFWQTGWFRIAVVVGFSSVLVGVARYIFIRRMRSKLLALEQQAALDRSRMAGMADVAASVLHNVGNELNSVNVSSTIVRDKLRHVKTANLHKAVGLLMEHANDLPGFFANDPKGKHLPDYLSSLAQHMTDEQEEVLRELSSLDESIEHIKEIVAAQQRYAQAAGVLETFKPADVVDDALRIHTGALEEEHVQIVRDYQEVPPVVTDKHKVLQILVTLIGNAKQALETAGAEDKRLVVRVGRNGGDRITISVVDNGVGIPKENLTRIFQQGFATAKSGRGIGLHSGANAARELGGSLAAESEGPGKGATFTLEFPADSSRNQRRDGVKS